jgi:hypothetical protein
MHTERASTVARLHAQRDNVCVCLYRVRTHMVPQTHKRDRTQFDDEDEAEEKPFEAENEDEVSERLGRSARRVSLRA